MMYLCRRTLLDPMRAKIFDALVQGVAKFEANVEFPRGTTIQGVHDAYRLLHFEVPEAYYIKEASTQQTYVQKAGIKPPEKDRDISMNLSYQQKPDVIRDEVRKMSRVTTAITKRVRSVSNVEQQALMLHDWLLANCVYSKEDETTAYDARGALLHGKAVCAGIARAYKYLCDRVDIPCVVVAGYAFDDDEIVENGRGVYSLTRGVAKGNASSRSGVSGVSGCSSVPGRSGVSGRSGRMEEGGLLALGRAPGRIPDTNHEWNMVYTSAGWRHVDVTFDRGATPGSPKRDYFLISEAKMSKDRSFSGLGLPR